ncbi:DUF4279 domain-containing protein [Morganella psychrotolerans]|uniref:DUF4279 domain-containing protein n=1 Tax=Morganella psychrotolerans TaxID=368603 RepID=A0A5M9R8G3_9GAMM|nr:DUF4279 domain-containing protein [Morganella psychrotolerans]KAA8717244.1 DUF4279 domain-containing protein [Morganella psychrotolerans]
MNKTTVKAEFSIYGDDFNPDEITELLGISPMEVNLKGTINGTRKRPSTETNWSIYTRKEESYDVKEQTRKIISILNDKVIILNEIKKKYNISFMLSLLIEVENGEKPAIYWTPETNYFLGSIGAESSVDIYIYS